MAPPTTIDDRSGHGSMTDVEGAEEGEVGYEMTREDWGERRKNAFQLLRRCLTRGAGARRMFDTAAPP